MAPLGKVEGGEARTKAFFNTPIHMLAADNMVIYMLRIYPDENFDSQGHGCDIYSINTVHRSPLAEHFVDMREERTDIVNRVINIIYFAMAAWQV